MRHGSRRTRRATAGRDRGKLGKQVIDSAQDMHARDPRNRKQDHPTRADVAHPDPRDNRLDPCVIHDQSLIRTRVCAQHNRIAPACRGVRRNGQPHRKNGGEDRSVASDQAAPSANYLKETNHLAGRWRPRITWFLTHELS